MPSKVAKNEKKNFFSTKICFGSTEKYDEFEDFLVSIHIQFWVFGRLFVRWNTRPNEVMSRDDRTFNLQKRVDIMFCDEKCLYIRLNKYTF